MFKECLPQSTVSIKSIEGDGNCLFRAVSYQLYNTSEHHQIIRSFCMDLIEIDKESYSEFIHEHSTIESYIQEKRKPGVWGDNIEIQALSELYQIPIYIYHLIQNYDSRSQIQRRSGFDSTIKTNNSINFLYENYVYEIVCKIFPKTRKKDNVSSLYENNKPIRLLYHEEVHYDSLHYINDNPDPIIHFGIGAIESKAISCMKKDLLKINSGNSNNKGLNIKINSKKNRSSLVNTGTIISNSCLNPKSVRFEYETEGEPDHYSVLRLPTKIKNRDESYHSEYYSTDKESETDRSLDEEINSEQFDFDNARVYSFSTQPKQIDRDPAHLTIIGSIDESGRNEKSKKFLPNDHSSVKLSSTSRKKCVAISCPSSGCKHPTS